MKFLSILFFSFFLLGMSKSKNIANAVNVTPDSNQIWVAKSDQAKSCTKEGMIDLDSMALELKKSGITFNKKKKIFDSAMRIQMCGADKGSMNAFLIDKNDLEKAKSLGFNLVNSASSEPIQ